MLSTNRGQTLSDIEELAMDAGVDPNKPLTEGQIKMAKRFGLDLDKTRISHNLRNYEDRRISSQELKSRGQVGETATLALKEESGEELTHNESYYAYKMNVNPILAKRAKNTTLEDQQKFIPKAERQAAEIRSGKWNLK